MLKAGKFYVPIEPTDAADRRRAILDASTAPLVITDAFRAEPVPHDPEVVVKPSDPAYVFFTSGTTGIPKGVLDSQRNVLHNVYRYTNALTITPDDRLTVIQSANFSGTVSSVFCALLNGAVLLPFSLGTHGFAALADWIQRSRATIMHSVPSIFRGIVDAGSHFPDVRVVRLEGDGATQLDHTIFQRAFNAECILAHGLGATETGLSCQFKATRESRWEGERMPVGRPLPDIDLRIVSEPGETAVVAAGTTGEIEVISEFLAMGYWRDASQTHERFSPVPGDPVRRRYRSGDLGMVGADGLIYHLGRVNQEHRINGQWVATGEVESALKTLGAFREVLVTTRRDTAGDPRLVAYVILAEGSAADPPRWKAALSARLLPHMIPRFFVVVESFPLGKHGKVDRAALPSPEAVPRAPIGTPRSRVEREMVACWETVLDIRPIGTRDNFFSLGGDSLRAALLVARVEKTFRHRVPASMLVAAPTVEAFVGLLEGTFSPATITGPLVPLQALGSRPPFFCVDWPGASGWQLGPLAHHLGNDQPFYCLVSGGLEEPWPKSTTIEDLAGAVIRHVRTVQPSGPIRLGGNCYGAIVALEAARQLRERGEPVALLAMFAISPMDFPTLVSPHAVDRYRAHSTNPRRATRRARLVGRGWQSVRRAGARLLRLVRGRGRAGGPFMARERAFKAYRPHVHEGEVVIFLSEETTRSYTNDAPTCWSGLGAQVRVHLLRGIEEELLAEPVVTDVAALLGRELEQPATPRGRARAASTSST